MNHSPTILQAQAALKSALEQRLLSESAGDNMTRWLVEPRYEEYLPQLLEQITDAKREAANGKAAKWKELDNVFWTVIPFGTGGRRGKMYPIGCNAINARTIGESAQGLANYIRSKLPPPYSFAIAYDTRHNSEYFAKLCAEIMAAADFHVYFLSPYRSTPQLSFSIRHFGCTSGIMVTASHNPPSDNAVKVYWSTGCQILPPHDKGIIDCVLNVDRIHRIPFSEAHQQGRIVECVTESDPAYQKAIYAQRFPGPRNLKVIYTPLHGVGATAVIPAMHADGFDDVQVYPPHAAPDGDFPNVPHHVANPENEEVFAAPIRDAQIAKADLILATDPDCDRLGCAAPLECNPSGPWRAFNGNQIGVLLTDYVLRQHQALGNMTPQSYVVKTMVTTDMIRRIADAFGVRTFGDLHVGFKWIGGLIDEQGPDHFLLGAEESHGYLVGQYARDKDGAVAAMLMAELAAELKAAGKSLHQRLDELYREHGYFAERLLNVQMPGSEGMQRMNALMESLRERPPQKLGGMPVRQMRDYKRLCVVDASGGKSTLQAVAGDMVMFDLEPAGNAVAVRPSGTEPKVKFYLFSAFPPHDSGDLESTKRRADERLSKLSSDLQQLIK